MNPRIAGKGDYGSRSQIIGSAEPLAELLRSLANPARVRVLAVCMQRDSNLVDMTNVTGLSKTALMNHVSQLAESGLVERVSRGSYRTTQDGRNLLSAASNAYRSSIKRSREEREALSRSFADALAGVRDVERTEIQKVYYVPCWLSYLGAMSGCLRYLGVKCGTMDVGGHSGYSFLVNVAKGETCPSGPTALHLKTFREMVRGTESLGWKLDLFTHERPYPAIAGKPTPSEIALVRGIFRLVKKEIDQNRRPVVLWGLVAPEYGIVKGYQGESYLVSTFRGLSTPGKPEEPVPYQDLKAPGCIDAFYFRERLRIRPAKARREALQRAIDFASGTVEVQKNYVAGPDALEAWAEVLETADDGRQNYMGNSYVAACVEEGRTLSGQFLKHLAKRSTARQSRYLLEAARSYEKGARFMSSFTRMFPFKFQGEMPLLKRSKGARILRTVRTYEERAIQNMNKV